MQAREIKYTTYKGGMPSEVKEEIYTLQPKYAEQVRAVQQAQRYAEDNDMKVDNNGVLIASWVCDKDGKRILYSEIMDMLPERVTALYAAVITAYTDENPLPEKKSSLKKKSSGVS